MKQISVSVSSPVSASYRAVRVRSMFNVTPADGATFSASCSLPADE